MRLRFPHGLNASDFLRDYWQKSPLLMARALPYYRCPVGPGELAGLACEDEVESRIVLERGGIRPWEARQGPFDEKAFSQLPSSHWTLLVQDVEKHVPDVAELLTAFQFLPKWRLDDIMISYAADQGSVGPHIDDYDVFLVQTMGRRRWQINTETDAGEDYIHGLDLRILPSFTAEVQWVLEPGDILYLPPNVAHWGVAEGNDCMTCSVGYQAPSLHELTSAWFEELIQTQLPREQRYRDGELFVQQHNGEIDRSSLERIVAFLSRLQVQDFHTQARWFGRFITEPKPHLPVFPIDNPLTSTTLREEIGKHGLLARNRRSNFVFIRGCKGEDYLYANGEEFVIPDHLIEFLQLISGTQEMDIDTLKPWLTHRDSLRLITDLYNAGHLLIP